VQERTVRLRGLAASIPALFVAVVLVVGVVAGCSSGGTVGSATTTAGVVTTRTSTTSVIQGDKSKEEYLAELPGLEAKAKATPEDRTALLDLAAAYYMVDRIQDAAAVYEQMLKLGEDPTLRNNYGNMLRDMGKTEEALAAYRKALEADPTLVVAYVNLAALLVREGKKDEAMSVLDGGIAKVEGEDKTRLEGVKTALQK
jgi:Tfp pilus assembly protein PilF